MPIAADSQSARVLQQRGCFACLSESSITQLMFLSHCNDHMTQHQTLYARCSARPDATGVSLHKCAVGKRDTLKINSSASLGGCTSCCVSRSQDLGGLVVLSIVGPGQHAVASPAADQAPYTRGFAGACATLLHRDCLCLGDRIHNSVRGVAVSDANESGAIANSGPADKLNHA